MNTDPISFVDATGQMVFVGDTITYPGRVGSRMWMNFGTVERIERDADTDREWYRPEWHIKVRKYHRVAEWEANSQYYNPKGKLKEGDITHKDVTLNVVERIVRIADKTPEALAGL